MAKILIIDDDRASRTLFADALSYDGHLVFEGGNGREGLELAEIHRPDLVISDNRMPAMSGIDFLSALRARPGFTHTPLILCSAASEAPEARQAAKNSTFAALISKPVNLKSLRAAVAAALKAMPPETLATINRLLAARIPSYLAAREADVTLIERALAENDFARIEGVGHDMKGTGATYGFPQLTEIGDRLESAARSAEPGEIAAQLKNLAACLHTVRAERALPDQETRRSQRDGREDEVQ